MARLAIISGSRPGGKNEYRLTPSKLEVRVIYRMQGHQKAIMWIEAIVKARKKKN